MKHTNDTIIIGSGAGGSAIAHALANSGRDILILERGGFLPREKENWDPSALYIKDRYGCQETWLDRGEKPFTPSTHYYVGGNTLFYGTTLMRLRENDFKESRHFGGISPAWPIGYEEFRPYYQMAEELYEVRGERNADPTEPPEEKAYPFPAVSHEGRIEEIARCLTKIGLHPFHLPLGIRLNEKDRSRSLCIRCDTCDGYPCLVYAKADARQMCLSPILSKPNVHLLTHAKALRLIPDATGQRIEAVEVEHRGEIRRLTAREFIVSAGAVNSAALLLRSKCDAFPQGLANRSGLVGRNYMCHQNTAVIAISLEEQPVVFPKTVGVNDFYFESALSPYPLGSIQLMGKIKPEILASAVSALAPRLLLNWIADRSIGWWIVSEDLPDAENRVAIDDAGKIHLHYRPNNEEAHRRLLKEMRKILRHTRRSFLGVPLSSYLQKKISIAGVEDQVGTLRFGKDPATSVLDLHCRAHDLENLYVVDGSFFPSSGAVNPCLTIVANALRVGEYLKLSK